MDDSQKPIPEPPGTGEQRPTISKVEFFMLLVLWRWLLGTVISVFFDLWPEIIHPSKPWNLNDYFSGFFEMCMWMGLGWLPGALIQEFVFGKVLNVTKTTEEKCLWTGVIVNIALSPIDVLHIVFLDLFFNHARLPVVAVMFLSASLIGAWNAWLRYRAQNKLTKWFPQVSLVQLITATLGTGATLLLCMRSYMQ